MRRKKLLNEIIRVYQEFLDLRLWNRFGNFDCFAVEAVGEEEPLLACVMGSAGEEYGLMLLRGSEAAEHMRSIQFQDENGDDRVSEADLLSITLDLFGKLPSDLKAFYRRVGIRPRHNEMVPFLLCMPPFRQTRLPNEAELILLLDVLKTVVEADRKKLLTPAELDDPEGICVVTPAGPSSTEVTVYRERFPHRPLAPEKIECFLSPQGVVGLDRLDETWLVGTSPLPAGIEGEERVLSLLIVVEEESGMILQGRPYFADSLQEAICALEETIHGSELRGGRTGLPRKIAFASRALHDAVAPALGEVGVQCEYRSSIPVLQEVLASFMASTGGPVPEMPDDTDREGLHQVEVPAPDDLAGWKAADYRLNQRFQEFFRSGDRLQSSRAVKRYFDDDDIRHYLTAYANVGVAMSYICWGVVDYRPTRKSKTEAEKMLASGLPPAEEMLLRARMESHPTIYRVARHDSEAGTADLEDVLLGGTVTIHDQLFSENIFDNVLVTARAYAAGRFFFFESIGPPMAAQMGEEVVDFLEECEMEFSPEGLRRDAHMFGWLWDLLEEEWQADQVPPKLTNTDGEDLIWHTASFSVVDPEAARQSLRRRPDVDYDDQAGELVWLRELGKGAMVPGDTVTLGRIEFIGDELILSVNSAERLEKARSWLEMLPGVEFRSVTTRRFDEPLEDRPMDEQIAMPEPIEDAGEAAAALQEIIDKHSMEWLDTPVPALGGKTPRQACRTAEGRRNVITMIRTWPDPAGDLFVQVPRQAMLKALGLETGGRGEAEESELTIPPGPGSGPLNSGREKVGRNDPCPCGSGKKFKKCCGR